MSAIERFAPATRAWFTSSFDAPTRVQELGWPSIAGGEHSLLLAPTGSGKTLAAFLWCIDRLSRLPADAGPGFRVLYVSPLKALVYDIERNLRAPLVGIRRAAERLGEGLRPIEVSVRTGDTSQRERQRMAKHPGEILVTTPESLYLMLGSAVRETLRSVETVIVDEVHAVAGTKRGTHLALSLERLVELTGREPQRIGLSATVRPVDEVGRFLVGARSFQVVDASEPPHLDLEIFVPLEDMTRPELDAPERPRSSNVLADELDDGLEIEASKSVWPAIHPVLLELVRAHRSTIVFANSRTLCEKLASKLNELAEEQLVLAHHGSIAHEQRRDIEEALKAGQLRGIVATSSLELGIDMGAVDLVVQIESPSSVAQGLQRVGRAGHAVGERSQGRICPKFRGDLLEATVVARRMLDGEIESLRVPKNALDVLAQQIVATVALDPGLHLDDLERMIHRTHSYRELSRDALVAVLDMLSGRYPDSQFAELAPRIIWDRTEDTFTPRKGAKMVSLLSGGTIPDRGLYAVHLGPDGPRVGELDEEMVYESRPGQTFLLGASSWRIEDITWDRVIVRPAPGEPARMPFWKGEGPGRPVELGRALGAFVREVSELPPAKRRERICEYAPLDERAANNLLAYLDEQQEATGVLPSDRTIVIECFPDELGDLRVCIHSPFGGRVHAPWALAIEALLGREAGFEAQTMWSDDGIVLRLVEAEEPPDLELLLPDPDAVRDLVVEQLGGSPLFAAYFRENAARALLLPRRRPGKRQPLWLQRKRASDLLAVARQFPDFPIVLETYRACLQDVFDLPALVELLRAIAAREVRVEVERTTQASPFARSLVFAYVANYLYDGDAPLAERKVAALTLDRNLLADLLGQDELRELLDAEVLAQVEAELQALAPNRQARSADALHDLLRRLGDLDPTEVAERCVEPPEAWLAELEESRRAIRMRIAGDERWVAIEDAARYRDALGAVPPAGVPAAFLEPAARPLEQLVRRYLRTHGPFVTQQLAARFALLEAQAEAVLRLLESQQQALLGEFRPGGVTLEWCAPEVLAQLRRKTLAKLRGEIEPVGVAALGRFLPGWQGIGSGHRGVRRLEEVLVQLEGLPVSWVDLERRILPDRVADYRPAMLDELGTRGAIVWVGRGPIGASDGRICLYRREKLPLLAPTPEEPPEDSQLARAILEHLESRGASFFVDLQIACGRPTTAELLEALWELVWAGLITNDTFLALRRLGSLRKARGRRRAGAAQLATGRWSALRPLVTGPAPPTDTERAHARATMLLERYGVVTREAALLEELPGGFSAVYPVLRAMEEAGRIRRGYFVEGLSGAQFALPGAVERLRAARRTSEPVVQVLPAQDPANPWGALLPWPAPNAEKARPRRAAGTYAVSVAGHLTLFLERGGRRLLTFGERDDEERLLLALRALDRMAAGTRKRMLRVETIDEQPARRSPLARLLERADFKPDYRGLTLALR